MNFFEFATAIKPVAEYYSRNLTDATATLYFELVREIGVEDFEAALVAHMRDPVGGKFWPTAAHVLDRLAGEDEERESLIRKFNADPTVDGTGRFDADHESHESRNARRDRFVRAALDEFRRFPVSRKIQIRRDKLALESQSALQ